MSVNFDIFMEKQISGIDTSKNKPTLLLHSCCAPCFTGCIERLTSAFDVTVFYYNPNVDTIKEFELRRDEQMRICNVFGVKFIDEGFNSQDFFSLVKGYENLPEGGDRCSICFRLRLEKTVELAQKKAFEYFATTLTLSPLKNAEKINSIGIELQEKYGVMYLRSDFKKRGGYQRSIELSKAYGLYRQNYCGCVFSKKTQ